MDERLKILAKNLVNYSCAVKPGEKVLIEVTDAPDEVPVALVNAVYAAQGIPYVKINRAKVQRDLLMNCTKEQIEDMTRYDSARMKDMQCYISFRANDNASESSDVSSDKMALYQSIYQKEVHSNLRVAHTKWVVLRYPNSSMAQLAGMSTAGFEELYYNVCNLDYGEMDKAMDSLKAFMERTDKVRLVSPGTDLSFSIKGMHAEKCSGLRNIPDGEVYTAPLKTSVNGTIAYNAPSSYNGFKYENVVLTFKDGKIIDAQSNNTQRINKVFDTDEGARYVGEFAIGVNPYINHPMGDILFDEKIAGSIHFTPGSCYDDADNGNKSAIHWDLVLVQTPQYGGGEIYFDDVLIRKDGKFVADELVCLNPENLV